MDLGIIEIDKEEAEARVAEYEQVLKAERTAEDEAILSAYRAAKRGLPVISLSRAFDYAGYHVEGPHAGLPKLAIIRADAKECWVTVERSNQINGGNRLTFSNQQNNRSQGALVGKNTTCVHTSVSREGGQRWRGRTIVPVVPPRHRPKRGRLGTFHIMWEVDEWSPAPPVDPALLRHIRGDLWSVVAVWDLTELERLVLSQRISQR